MKFWLKTPNNIYKNWLNSHIDRIMCTVSKLEIKNVTIQVEHPICHLTNLTVYENLFENRQKKMFFGHLMLENTQTS